MNHVNRSKREAKIIDMIIDSHRIDSNHFYGDIHKYYQSVFVGRSLLKESITLKMPLLTHSVASVS